MIRFVLLVVVCGALPTYIGGARAQTGGIGSELQAMRVEIGVLRGEHTRASVRRCWDEITVYAYRDVRRIPASRVRAIRSTWISRLADIRSRNRPRQECWRSHQWAESRAGRCVSSLEGGLRSVSQPSGTYHGKWQSNRAFEEAYGREFVRRGWGRASNWPEWAQDLMGWRGWSSRGWHPWPNTARRCGLL